MPGNPYPQGANWDGAGVNFSLFSENATGVELCLYDDRDQNLETCRIAVTEQIDRNGWIVEQPAVSYTLSRRDIPLANLTSDIWKKHV